jgi:hypothetical protein
MTPMAKDLISDPEFMVKMARGAAMDLRKRSCPTAAHTVDTLTDEYVRLRLAEAVASAASVYMVAVRAYENAFDEEDALEAALKPWREARASAAEPVPDHDPPR